ncbi:MAG: hypothetical protein U1C46_06015 [Bacteroidales bacterium]|nr:hypothetical protein [Bacteroidales bacterium]MDZ4204355.1 hypothetical protein [Bacteroidales bacterium]
MKRYAFLVYHADYQHFLEELRNLGVLDVVQRTREYGSKTMDKLLLQKQIDDTVKLLRRRKVEEKTASTVLSDGMQVVELVKTLTLEEEQTHQQLIALNKEIANLQPWGDFSKETLQKLREAGLRISFHISSIKKYNPAWENVYNIGIVNTISPNVYFIIARENDDEIGIDTEEIRIPERTLSELYSKRDQLNERLSAISQELDGLTSAGISPLLHTQEALQNETEFEKVLANTRLQADDSVMLLEGFVPITREADLVRFCEEREILYVSDKPSSDDKVPVLLQNNKFSKLFEPISKLFSLPAYAELDLTPFFAPFFMMFFGFCLGDAGYGLLVLLGATLYKRKAKPAFRPYLSLAQYLGLATIIFGIISGTFFGINLIEARIGFLDSVRSYFFDSQKMFYLALIVGGIQIIFGMFVKVYNILRQQGFAYALSTIGWLILILGMIARFALIHFEKLPADEIIVMYLILGISGVLILLLNDPKANVFVRMGKGVWDVYGTVTGIFGDLLSYIRLFALGISSAILGLVINSIGMDMLGIPILGPVLFVLFLTVGHLANILISSLGSIVHPMRLTFVEFYKNAGFTGGGKEYKPFAEKAKN